MADFQSAHELFKEYPLLLVRAQTAKNIALYNSNLWVQWDSNQSADDYQVLILCPKLFQTFWHYKGSEADKIIIL